MLINGEMLSSLISYLVPFIIENLYKLLRILGSLDCYRLHKHFLQILRLYYHPVKTIEDPIEYLRIVSESLQNVYSNDCIMTLENITIVRIQ